MAAPLRQLKPVPRLGEGGEGFARYFERREPVIIPGASAKWPAAREWDVDRLRAIIRKHGVNTEKLECVVHDESNTNSTHYANIILKDIDAYLDIVKGKKPSPQGSKVVALKNGINVERKAVAKDCPVPDTLAKLHEEGKIVLRDLMGREYCRLFISGRGFHGRCHYDRFGYAFFTVQIRGSKTWYLYSDDLPLRRVVPFDNAPSEDFTKAEVNQKYPGYIAELKEGDMLFLPPYTYHSVKHTGDFNVNIDFFCLLDKVWSEAAKTMMLALQDIGGMMGGIPLMGYVVPKLIPNPAVQRQVQMKLLRKNISAEAIGPVFKHLMMSKSKDLDNAIDAAKVSAKGHGEDSMLLECCIASELIFSDEKTLVPKLLRSLSFFARGLAEGQNIREFMIDLNTTKEEILTASMQLKPNELKTLCTEMRTLYTQRILPELRSSIEESAKLTGETIEDQIPQLTLKILEKFFEVFRDLSKLMRQKISIKLNELVKAVSMGNAATRKMETVLNTMRKQMKQEKKSEVLNLKLRAKKMEQMLARTKKELARHVASQNELAEKIKIVDGIKK